jgi:hypothetical protein
VEEGGPGPVLRTPFGELGENTKIIIIIYPKEIKYFGEKLGYLFPN